nr:MAG TPA: hypothetical protein [Caudoviricetes sp.]
MFACILIFRFDLRFYKLRHFAATNHTVYYALHIDVRLYSNFQI